MSNKYTELAEKYWKKINPLKRRDVLPKSFCCNICGDHIYHVSSDGTAYCKKHYEELYH